MSLQTPVLFCIFNRPDVTRQVFAAIRQQRPKTLLVVQDGPRANHEPDSERIAVARQVLDLIDWPCDLRTNFAESNLGCRQRMATGITWGFAQCERMIILEDDCLPGNSFFGFCEALLERYANDDRVMMISGNNFQPIERSPYSYYFSKWSHIWGWASWRTAWQRFDVNIATWPSDKLDTWLSELCCDASELEHWNETFDRQFAGAIDTWDFPWMYSLWRQGGLAVLPNCNLVTNLGFGPMATHTTDVHSPWANLPFCEIETLRHPAIVIRHNEADAYTWNRVFKQVATPIQGARAAKLNGWWRGLRRAAMGVAGGDSCQR